MLMHDRKNYDLSWINLIQNRIRESSNDSTSDASLYFECSFRVIFNAVYSPIDF